MISPEVASTRRADYLITPEQTPRIGADRGQKHLNIGCELLTSSGRPRRARPAATIYGRKCSATASRLSCLPLNKGQKYLTKRGKTGEILALLSRAHRGRSGHEGQRRKNVCSKLLGCCHRLYSGLVHDWLQEEEQREVRADTWETDIVDDYYDGRLAGIGPTQHKLSAKYRVSQREVSATIRQARRDVWENWDWGRSNKDYEGEVDRVAGETDLEPATVSAIVALNENFTVRRRRSSDAKPDRAKQGKLL